MLRIDAVLPKIYGVSYTKYVKSSNCCVKKHSRPISTCAFTACNFTSQETQWNYSYCGYASSKSYVTSISIIVETSVSRPFLRDDWMPICLAHRKFRGDAHLVSLHFQWFGLGCGHPAIDSCWMAMGFLGWKYGTLLWTTRKPHPWIELDNMIGDLESEERSSQILWVRCLFSLCFFRRLNELMLKWSYRCWYCLHIFYFLKNNCMSCLAPEVASYRSSI